MLPLLLGAGGARAEEPAAEPAEAPACQPPVIHRHATLLPANAPGFLVDAGTGRISEVRVVQTDMNRTIPIALEDDFVRFGAPLEPYTHLSVEISDDCAGRERPVNYMLDVTPEAPRPTALGTLTVGRQVEGLLPLGGVAGSRVDEYGWEPVGVFRESTLRLPPKTLPYEALLRVRFVYDGREDAPVPPEAVLVEERYKSVVHARCDRGRDVPGIGEGTHRIEAIGVFMGMDLELRAGPADVKLECTPEAVDQVEGHRTAIAMRPWYELYRWFRRIRQDAFAILVLLGFGWALVRFKRKRQKNWPFAPD